VDAIQPPQQRGLRGLHAQRYAVDPAGGQRIGKGLRQRAGIAFHRPFGVRGDIKVRPQRPRKLSKQCRGQKGRRAAAKKHRICGGMAALRRAAGDLGAHRVRIARHIVLAPWPGCKIAVGALARAERHMDIQTQRRHGKSSSFLKNSGGRERKGTLLSSVKKVTKNLCCGRESWRGG